MPNILKKDKGSRIKVICGVANARKGKHDVSYREQVVEAGCCDEALLTDDQLLVCFSFHQHIVVCLIVV